MKIPVFLFLIVLAINEAYSQKILYLKPTLGVQNVLCHYDRKIDKLDAFKVNKPDIVLGFGISAEMQLSEKWAINAGWHKGTIGWSYKIIMPENVTKTSFKIGQRYSVVYSNYIHRFPLLLKYNLGNRYVLTRTNDKNRTKFNLKVYTLSGLSLDYIPNNSFDPFRPSQLFSGSFDSHGDSIIIYQGYRIKAPYNVSLIAGIGLHCNFKNRQLFDLNIYYSQGIRNMMEANIDYQMNSIKSNTRLLTRGSVFGILLSIPIKIKTFEMPSNYEVNKNL